MVFVLGDEDLPNYADELIHAFGCALHYLRSEILVSSLHISLAFHTFSSAAQLSWFASALSKIKVQDKVTITGHEKFLDIAFMDLPINLGMHMMPAYANFWAYNPNDQYSTGWFLYHYVSEKHVSKDADPLHERFVVDIKYLMEVVKTYARQLGRYVGAF